MRAMDPEMRALLDAARRAGVPTFEEQAPGDARRTYAATRRAAQAALPRVELDEVRDIAIQADGGTLALRVYRDGPPGERLPGLLFLHGGGWVVGDLDTHDGLCRRLSKLARCCVVAVDYRLAPEHPFPAAVDDAAAALRWLAAEADALGVDPDRLAVAGDSAGGNLAAVLALMARDGAVPPLRFQALLYPAVDLSMAGHDDEGVPPGLPLTAASMRWFIGHYVPDAASREGWRASPLRAPSLAGAPPALVLTCGHDPLREEGRLYAARLEREGVPVAALHVADQAHGFLNLAGAVGAAEGVTAFVAATLRDAWRRGAAA